MARKGTMDREAAPHAAWEGGYNSPRSAKLTADAPPTTMWSSTRGVEWGRIVTSTLG